MFSILLIMFIIGILSILIFSGALSTLSPWLLLIGYYWHMEMLWLFSMNFVSNLFSQVSYLF